MTGYTPVCDDAIFGNKPVGFLDWLCLDQHSMGWFPSGFLFTLPDLVPSTPCSTMIGPFAIHKRSSGSASQQTPIPWSLLRDSVWTCCPSSYYKQLVDDLGWTLTCFRQFIFVTAVLVHTPQETRRWCSMHACNLGIFLVVIAEGILLLARNLCHQLSLEESLQVTYLKFKSWLSTKGISCSQRRWTPKSLHMTGEVPNYPWLKAKAFNARVILGWLAETYLQRRRILFFLIDIP